MAYEKVQVLLETNQRAALVREYIQQGLDAQEGTVAIFEKIRIDRTHMLARRGGEWTLSDIDTFIHQVREERDNEIGSY